MRNERWPEGGIAIAGYWFCPHGAQHGGPLGVHWTCCFTRANDGSHVPHAVADEEREAYRRTMREARV